MGEPYSRQSRFAIQTGYTAKWDGTITSSSPPGSAMSITNSISGEKMPNWKSIVRAGGNATTPCSGSELSGRNSWFSATRNLVYKDATRPDNPVNTTQTWDGYYPFTFAWPSTGVPSDIKSRIRDRCLRTFLSNALSAQTGTRAGETLGEIRETIHMMTRPLASLQELVLGHFSRLRKRRRGLQSKRQALKVITDSYLELNFGWNPLAKQIGEAYVAWQNRGNHYDFVRVHGSASEDYSGASSVWYLPGLSLISNQGTFQTVSKCSVRMDGMVKTGASGTNWSVPRTFGLLPEQFVPTLWELIPYSFVVDYFTNVGDIIQSMCFPFSSLAWAKETTRDSTTFIFGTPRYLEFNPLASYQTLISDRHSIIGSNVKFTGKSWSRLPIIQSSQLIPSLHLYVPLVSKPWVNIGALLAQKSSGLVPYYPPNRR